MTFDSISEYFGYLFISNKNSIIGSKFSDYFDSIIFNKGSIKSSFVLFKESYNLHLILTNFGSDISNILNILHDLTKAFSLEYTIKSPLHRFDIKSNGIASYFKIENDHVSVTNPNYINIGYDIIPTTLLGFLYFYIKYLSSVSFDKITMILPNEKYEYRILCVYLEGNMINLCLRSPAHLQSKEIKINYDNIEEIKIKNDEKIVIKLNLNNN